MNNTIVGIIALVCLVLYLQRRRARLSSEE